MESAYVGRVSDCTRDSGGLDGRSAQRVYVGSGMEVELSKKTINLIADAVIKRMKREPEVMTTKEAAELLGITEDRLRRIKDRLPHIKGEGKQGRLLFFREGLVEGYLG